MRNRNNFQIIILLLLINFNGISSAKNEEMENNSYEKRRKSENEDLFSMMTDIEPEDNFDFDKGPTPFLFKGKGFHGNDDDFHVRIFHLNFSVEKI